MKDWRLEGPDVSFLKNETIKTIIFPNYWNEAFATKNDFYQAIKSDGEAFVKKFGRGSEFLVGERIQDFWHEHCIFCTQKITTRDNRVCYFNAHYSSWICQTCYEDFKHLFNWRVIN